MKSELEAQIASLTVSVTKLAKSVEYLSQQLDRAQQDDEQHEAEAPTVYLNGKTMR